MCQTIPGRVSQVQGNRAEVEMDGKRNWFDASVQPSVKQGDYVLTHANLIVGIISQEEAQRLQQAVDDLRQARDTATGGSGGGSTGS